MPKRSEPQAHHLTMQHLWRKKAVMPELVCTESWWVGVDRDEFNRRLAKRQHDMSLSKFGKMEGNGTHGPTEKRAWKPFAERDVTMPRPWAVDIT